MSSRRAFTLIEIIVVISIILILAAIVSHIAGQSKRYGDKVACISNLKNLHTNAILYFQDNYSFTEVNDLEDKRIFNVISQGNLSTAQCPAARDAFRALYTIWGPTISNINNSKSIASLDSGSRLLFIDQYYNSHANFANGILSNGKLVQYINGSFASAGSFLDFKGGDIDIEETSEDGNSDSNDTLNAEESFMRNNEKYTVLERYTEGPWEGLVKKYKREHFDPEQEDHAVYEELVNVDAYTLQPELTEDEQTQVMTEYQEAITHYEDSLTEMQADGTLEEAIASGFSKPSPPYFGECFAPATTNTYHLDWDKETNTMVFTQGAKAYMIYTEDFLRHGPTDLMLAQSNDDSIVNDNENGNSSGSNAQTGIGYKPELVNEPLNISVYILKDGRFYWKDST